MIYTVVRSHTFMLGVAGSCEDEGTLFSLSTLNLTWVSQNRYFVVHDLTPYRTEEEAAAYLKSNYFPNASDATISRLFELYPADPAAGSPFGTGNAFAFTPEFKRLAAFQGDFIFQATRRFLLDQRAGKQVVRSFRESPFSLKSCCKGSAC